MEMTPIMTTASRRHVNPLALQPEDILIEDIAHHLSQINRFNGALRNPMSVAQHSIGVRRMLAAVGCKPIVQLQGLLHDAPEAYLGDVTKWLKAAPEMKSFREAETRAWVTIARVYKLDIVLDSRVEAADALIVRYEAHLNDIELPNPAYGPLKDFELAFCNSVLAPWGSFGCKLACDTFLREFTTLSNLSSFRLVRSK